MAEFTTNGITLSYEMRGDGPPLLLLHGFPQTRQLWRRVADQLSDRFTCVMPDLRGYGASSKPPALPDLSNYSFRAMAGDVLALMSGLGFERFHLAGHDRGGRVAHRAALDAPGRVATLCLMDIVPTLYLVENWSFEVGRAYYHWSFLAQPAPLPERMIAPDPDAFYEAGMLGWGGAQLSDFPDIDAYRAAWRDPDTIAAMTNDYRAAVSVDVALDRADEGRRVTCPSLVLYGADGAMGRAFDVPATWRDRLDDMTAAALPGGHFFVDQSPGETARALGDFLAGHPGGFGGKD